MKICPYDRKTPCHLDECGELGCQFLQAVQDVRETKSNMPNVVASDPRAVGPAKWIEIEQAAKAVLDCVEEMPNGDWRPRVAMGARYHVAMKMLYRLVHEEPMRLDWLRTNGGAPMFAYRQPFVKMTGPTPIASTQGVDRFSILNEGGEAFVLRWNDKELARKSVSQTAIAELQQVAEGYINLRYTSSGDRKS